MSASMIVKVNGVPFGDFYDRPTELEEMEVMDYIKGNYSKKDINKLRKLAPWLWGISGIMFTSGFARAEQADPTQTSLWSEMMPIFRIFQDIAMVLGAIAIISGLIVMMFKKTEGRKFVMTSLIVLGGCFVVPAAITLIAILAGTINDTLIDVFRNSNLKGSVEVGG